MLFLSAVPQGDPVALGMVLVLALIVAVMALRKHRSRKKPVRIPMEDSPILTEPARVTSPRTRDRKSMEAPDSAGTLKIHNVEPKTAAMIMAITAHKMGKPLNELRFISIKEVTNS